MLHRSLYKDDFELSSLILAQQEEQKIGTRDGLTDGISRAVFNPWYAGADSSYGVAFSENEESPTHILNTI
jgi:hypothetical protein